MSLFCSMNRFGFGEIISFIYFPFLSIYFQLQRWPCLLCLDSPSSSGSDSKLQPALQGMNSIVVICITIIFYQLVWFHFFAQDNPLENLNLAFDVAEKYLDIPRMLDPEGKIRIIII